MGHSYSLAVQACFYSDVVECSTSEVKVVGSIPTPAGIFSFFFVRLFVLEFNVALTVFQSYRDVQLITGGGRPRGPLYTISGTECIRVEPPTYPSQLEGFLTCNIRSAQAGIRTHSGEGLRDYKPTTITTEAPQPFGHSCQVKL